MSIFSNTDKEILCAIDHADLQAVDNLQDSVLLDSVEPKVKKISAYYNSFRILLITVDSVLKNFKHSFLPKMFAIAGFVYAFEFIFDLSTIFYETCRTTSSNQHLSYWQRFKNALTADRVSHMVNAGLWIGINVAAFILTGGLSAILTLTGFGLDVMHAVVRSSIEIYKCQHVIKNVDIKLNHIKQKYEQENDPQEKTRLLDETIYYQQKKNQLIKLRNTTIKKSSALILGTALMFLGIAMMFFAPTLIPGAALIGACVFFGAFNSLFGFRIWNDVSTTCQTKQVVDSDINGSYTRKCAHLFKRQQVADSEQPEKCHEQKMQETSNLKKRTSVIAFSIINDAQSMLKSKALSPKNQTSTFLCRPN